MLSWRLWLRYW